jgi:ketosteroid isomerase-like protein
MSHHRVRVLLVLSMLCIPCAGFPATPSTSNAYAGTEQDRAALQKTGEAIRAAFARSDIETIMAYHHPDVIKATTYDRYRVGRDAVKADLLATFQVFNLSFEQYRNENTFFQGDTAVEQSLFTIKASPKDGSAPVYFKGRSLVVYVRYDKSPTGWASIRELIQPAP